MGQRSLSLKTLQRMKHRSVEYETYRGIVLNEEGYNNARQNAIDEYWYNHPADVSGNPTGTDAEAEAFADSQVNRTNYEMLKPVSPSQPAEWVRD